MGIVKAALQSGSLEFTPRKEDKWKRTLANRKKISESLKRTPLHPWRGKHLPKAHRDKIAKSNTGKKASLETRKKIGDRKWWTKERRENMSKALKGRIVSEEVKKKIGDFHRGRKRSAETCRRISESHKGKVTSDETKARLRKLRLGTKLSEEHKQAISRANKGKKNSALHNRRISKARLKQVIPVKDTTIEVALQKGLRQRGVYFTTHKALKGQPDIFIQPNICIFADGCYWHSCLLKDANDSEKRAYVREKDKRVTSTLEGEGYKVLRFWEHEINESTESCVGKIEKTIKEEGKNGCL